MNAIQCSNQILKYLNRFTLAHTQKRREGGGMKEECDTGLLEESFSYLQNKGK